MAIWRQASPFPSGHPSSNHQGGVVAIFCDGCTTFLAETVDYNVYQHLMTPDSNKVNLQAKAKSLGFNVSGVLNENDF